MSKVMQAALRGRKHRCGACGAAFYDLTRELTACPKCQTPYAAAQMPRGEAARKRQPWSRAGRRAEPEVPAAETDKDTTEGVPLLDVADDADDREEEDEEEGTEALEEDEEDAADDAQARDAPEKRKA